MSNVRSVCNKPADFSHVPGNSLPLHKVYNINRASYAHFNKIIFADICTTLL